MYNFPTRWLKRFALVVHRWTGAAFCLLFSWWFVSGIFMMYCDYPEVKEADRLRHAQPLNAALVKLGPAEAWAKLNTAGAPDNVTLAMFDGRPAYWFGIGRSQVAVFADDGQMQRTFPADLNLRTASAWAHRPASDAKAQAVTAPDQWTVGGVYREFAPLTKYSWPDGQEVYVSGRNGQVVQYSTRMSRLGAWLGPIPHWLYFTPLRTNGRLWSRIVIWLSGAATVVATLGLIVGLSMFSPSKRYRSGGAPTGVPYTGPKRLHMIFGLFFGVLACTWAFSGMLSMDPFPSQEAEESAAASGIAEALAGEPFSFDAFQSITPRAALHEVGSNFQAKTLEFLFIGVEPVYLAKQDSGHSLIIPMKSPPRPEWDEGRLVEIVGKARIAEKRWLTQYDAYYLDRTHASPLPVLRLLLNDAQHTLVYIDPRTARVVGEYHPAMWMERWAYHGLHSLNFPWLYNHRPAWDLVVLALMLGGTSLCVTSVIIAWRLIRRSLLRFEKVIAYHFR